MKLAVATICPHVWHQERWWSYEPFVLEMNVWGELFRELLMVAPVEDGPPPPAWSPYRSSGSISVIPFRRNKGHGLAQPRTSLLELPKMVQALISAALKTDAFHVRCPGSIGLLASLLTPMLCKRRVAKYAGQWLAAAEPEISNGFQKRLLRSRWWGAPVLVYGNWPDQQSHIVPFFTSIMNEAQMDRARTAARRDWAKLKVATDLARRDLAGARLSPAAAAPTPERSPSVSGPNLLQTRCGWDSRAPAAVAPCTGPRRPLEVLFVGRLSEAKNVDVIIRAIAQLQGEAESVRLRIVGDGPMRGSLEALARDLGIGDSVLFEGAVPQAKVLDFYEKAHVLVLASQTEGWPKAIAEAMAFGLVCVGSDRGLVPQMLGDGRGLLVEPRDVQALTGALRSVLLNPRRAEEIAKRAAAWSQQFTLERFRDALREVLESAWKVKLRPQSRPDLVAPALAPNPVLHDRV